MKYLSYDWMYFSEGMTKLQASGDIKVDALHYSAAQFPNFPSAVLAEANQNVIHYSFDIQGMTPDAIAFNAEQQAAATAMVQQMSAITGVKFELVGDARNAEFGFSYRDWSSTEPGPIISGIEINLNLSVQDLSSGFGKQMLARQYGEVMGLKLPGDYSSLFPGMPSGGGPFLPVELDHAANTVMSYNFDGSTDFGPLDIMALNWIYGGDGLQGRYGYNSTYGPSLTPGHFTAGQVLDAATAPTLNYTVYKAVGAPGIDVTAVQGGTFNDTINAGSRAFDIDGNSGIDTVVFSGNRANYQVGVQLTHTYRDAAPTAGTITSEYGQIHATVTGSAGTSNLVEVERVRFADKSIAFDMDGLAGDTVKLLGLVCGKAAVTNGSSFQLGTTTLTSAAAVGFCLNLLDTGAMSLADITQGLLTLKLGSGFTNEQEVSLLLQNLTGQSAASNQALAQSIAHDYLDSNTYTQASFVTAVAELPINQTYIGFTGMQAGGIEFV